SAAPRTWLLRAGDAPGDRNARDTGAPDAVLEPHVRMVSTCRADARPAHGSRAARAAGPLRRRDRRAAGASDHRRAAAGRLIGVSAGYRVSGGWRRPAAP